MRIKIKGELRINAKNLERKILLISFIAGLVFAVVEIVFSVYIGSKAVLMDAVYDSSELVFIGLILFLTPLFYKPITEKQPYGYFQFESIFIIVKGFMMLSVTGSVLATAIESAISGGRVVSGVQIAIFQCILGIISMAILIVMNRLNKSIDSPIIKSEILGWHVDVAYSLGMSLMFFISSFLKNTMFEFITPYFDQIVVVIIVIIMLPEMIKMIYSSIKDIFLFSPNEATLLNIKQLCEDILQKNGFTSKFYEVTRTGRQLWISIYFTIEEATLEISLLEEVSLEVNKIVKEDFFNSRVELILIPKNKSF
ncbi:MAG: cation transporter [Filifactoraceae bacterium]